MIVLKIFAGFAKIINKLNLVGFPEYQEVRKTSQFIYIYNLKIIWLDISEKWNQIFNLCTKEWCLIKVIQTIFLQQKVNKFMLKTIQKKKFI